MRKIPYFLVGLTGLALVVTSVGWYRSAAAGAEQRFDSCHFEGETLVLGFAYGANQAVEPRIDSRGGDVVVSLRTHAGSGDTPDVGLLGEARFAVFGGPAPVRYPDGEQLSCPRR